MNWISVVAIAIGLALDAFAVSIAAGLTLGAVRPREVFRLAFHFGLFQFLMPILGWAAGSQISSFVAAFDHWLAFALLSLIGAKMLRDAFKQQDPATRADPTRGWMLVTLSVATSIDALAVGLSMAFLDVNILLPCVVIGVVAALFSAVGITFSGRFLRRSGKSAEVLGGVVLILIGLRILYTHLA